MEGIEEKEKRNHLNNQNKSSKRREDHTYSKRLEFTERAYSQGPAKNFLPLQFQSNNTLSHILLEHNYFAHIGKENEISSVKKVSNNTKKRLDLMNSKKYTYTHADHCPLLKSPISTKQLWTESNMHINHNKVDTYINLNESNMNSR